MLFNNSNNNYAIAKRVLAAYGFNAFDPLLAHATAHCSPFCFTFSDLRGNLIGQFEANVFGQLQSLEVL